MGKTTSYILIWSGLFFALISSCENDGGKTSIILSELSTKEEFGEALFFDRSLSINNSISCASCHVPENAFTDGKRVAFGVKQRTGFRNTPTLINVGKLHSFMFDSRVPTLEMQALVPIQDTNEMGISMKELIERLSKVPAYKKAAREIYDRDFDAFVLTRSLAAYQRTLTSKGSRFDRFLGGDKNALSETEKAGWRRFNELNCVQCHSLPDFTNGKPRNNGFIGDTLVDQGRFRATGLSKDKGAFKVPTLRNIALTGPYMHNGGLSDLNQVLDHYRSNQKHPNADPLVSSLRISDYDKSVLKAFLNSLTDTVIYHSPSKTKK